MLQTRKLNITEGTQLSINHTFTYRPILNYFMFLTLRYCHSVSSKEAPGIILRLADEIQICPVLVAKFILEGYLREHQKREIEKYNALIIASSTSGRASTQTEPEPPETPNYFSNLAVLKQEVSRLLRDTTQIEDRNLAYEVYLVSRFEIQWFLVLITGIS